jgi:hypothetical protein
MTKSISTTSAFNPLGDKGQLPDMGDLLSALMVVCTVGQTAGQVAGSQALAKHVREITGIVCPQQSSSQQHERRPSKPKNPPKAG